MIQVREAIIVEGKYDKIKLSNFIDGLIITTDGFGIFKNKEKQALIRRLADTRGILILTDSDGAGFVIRNFLKGSVSQNRIKHAYIPDIFGKEKRKDKPSKEGKLGVEGISEKILCDAIARSGAECSLSDQRVKTEKEINKEISVADLNAVLLADERKVFAEFQNKLFQIGDDRFPQILLFEILRNIQKLQHIRIPQRTDSRMALDQILVLSLRKHCPLVKHTVDLPFKLTFHITVLNTQTNIKLFYLVGFAAGHDQQIIRPRNFSHQW